MSFSRFLQSPIFILAGFALLSACDANRDSQPAEAGLEATAEAFDPSPVIKPNEPPLDTTHPNSVQPETTLTIRGKGDVTGRPDLAILTLGVEQSATTAGDAMALNREAMNGVFESLKARGIEDRDMQTSNFSLQPVYDYSRRDDGQGPRLTGYRAANSLTVRIRDLNALGETMDSLIQAGGNTFSGLRFAMSDPREARNEARRKAIRDAISKAELYAAEAGYTVARIVTLSEISADSGPRPITAMARSLERSEPTPIASGEVQYDVEVKVEFELRK